METWSTWDAFRPGSGRFGWMVSPAAVVVTKEVHAMTPKEIKAIRNRLGWSRKELAANVPCAEGTVASWELGYFRPGPSYAARLQSLFEHAKFAPRRPPGKIVTCGCGKRYTKGDKCPHCKCAGVPSPAEIAAACRELQQSWSEADLEKHLKCGVDELEIPVIGRLCAGRRRRKGEGE